MRRSVRQVLGDARSALRAAGIEGADGDARLLVGATLGLDAAGLFLKGGQIVPEDAPALIDARIARRAGGEPVHRILGRRSFYRHDFVLSPATLEPRADTEVLVDLCRRPIESAISRRGACALADVGTGTGAIAVSLLALYRQARALAIDISAQALRTAAENALSAGVGERFVPVLSDHLSGIGGPLDLIVSNPPYIPSAEIAGLSREVREHDPIMALDGGEDGLRSYRAIAAEAPRVLGGDGAVAVEIGRGREDEVAAIFALEGFSLVDGADDLGGIRRALLFGPCR